ncbi:MAG: hypothetical protein JO025_09345 [Verrucomicrobia bacterium]|nr:hypothetical protein [Verrucomicrobiota bacterium]
METHSFALLESCILGSASSAGVSRIRELRIKSRTLSRRPVLLGFVAALFFSVVAAENDALATSAQSTTGGAYYGATDVLVNPNEHLSCPTTLQFDPKTNSATVTVNYRGTDMTTKINGTFRDGVFHGRSEGRFFGLVYVQAMNYTLKFDHRSGTVKATSWLVNPTPGTNNKPQTDVYRRTLPRSHASDEREGENATGYYDNSSGDSNRSGKNKQTSHLKDNIVEAKDTGERTKLVKSDSKAKATPASTHKK